jgi:hypothetical protein
MGYAFLDLRLLATFVERRHGETNNFHMPRGEMTFTLDDVCYLLHFSIQERLLDHKGIPTKTEGVEMMMTYIRSTKKKSEVNITKSTHVRFEYLKDLIKKYLKVINQAEKDGGTSEVIILECYK